MLNKGANGFIITPVEEAPATNGFPAMTQSIPSELGFYDSPALPESAGNAPALAEYAEGAPVSAEILESSAKQGPWNPYDPVHGSSIAYTPEQLGGNVDACDNCHTYRAGEETVADGMKWLSEQ